MNFTHRFAWLLALLVGFVPGLVRGDSLYDIGVSSLRGVTNLDGSGLRVAQPESSLSVDLLTWQVNPGNVGLPASRFTYSSSLGSTNVYPNSLGANSWHADAVGNYAYGIFYGVATNVARVDGSEANWFITNYVETTSWPMIGAPVVNQSFTFGPETVANQQYLDSIYDNAALTNRTLFISGANNNYGGGYDSPVVCAPATCYNGIGVGALLAGVIGNSQGPTADNGRSKPDLTAPSLYTSTSTPYVSGIALLLLQAAWRGDGGTDTNSATDPRTIKALLLNGAIKPIGWTNGSTRPLDARHGAGMVNAMNSWAQLAGGKQGSIISNLVSVGAAHPPIAATGTVSGLSGWDFSTNTSSTSPGRDAIQHYFFNVSNANSAVRFNATATLVWNRQFNKTSINNLDLFLYNCANSNLVAASTSLVDNVEHLYVTNLAQGRYDLQVWKAGGGGIVSAAEPYALAWEFAVPPRLAITSGTNSALTWPAYPAGFIVEARTNLLAGAWSTNGFGTPTVTNGLNNIPLNPTNAAQFFRLKSWRP